MRIKTLILNFEGTKTEAELYQVILGNMNEMIIAVGENVELLAKLKANLKDSLALVSNRQYQALQKCHQDSTSMPLKSVTSRLDLEQANLVSGALK